MALIVVLIGVLGASRVCVRYGGGTFVFAVEGGFLTVFFRVFVMAVGSDLQKFCDLGDCRGEGLLSGGCGMMGGLLLGACLLS